MADGSGVTTTGEVGALRYGRAIRRRWPLIALLTILGVIAGFVTAKPPAAANPLKTPAGTAPNEYSATSLLMPVSAGASAVEADPSGLSLSAMGFFATTGDVPRMVAQQLGYRGSPATLASQVSVTTNTNVGVLQISATEPTGPEAVKIVNAFSHQLINYLDNQIKQSYARQRSQANAQLQTLSSQIARLQQQGSSGIIQAEVAALQAQYKSDATQYAQLQGNPPKTNLTVIQPPVAVPGAAPIVGTAGTTGAASAATPASTTAVATTSSSHSKIPQGRVARGLLGGAVGLLVGLALALILDRFDTRLFRAAEIEDAFDLPLLAELRSADAEEPVVAVAPLSEAAERYRMMQASLVAEESPRTGAAVILVAPLHTAGGGGVVAANLAVAFRDAGHTVTVVTAEPYGRLGGMLAQGGQARQPGSRRNGDASGAPGLQVVAADGASPGARTSQMIDLVEAARATSDVVIVDSAPLLEAHDATRLAPRSNAIVLVAVAGRERTADATRATSLLRMVDGPVAGLAVLKMRRRANRARSPRPRAQGRHARSGPRLPPSVSNGPPTSTLDGVGGVVAEGASGVLTNGAVTHIGVEEGASAAEEPQP